MSIVTELLNTHIMYFKKYFKTHNISQLTFITALFVYIWANRHHFLVNYWTPATQTTPMFLFVFDAKEDARSMFRPMELKFQSRDGQQF